MNPFALDCPVCAAPASHLKLRLKWEGYLRCKSCGVFIQNPLPTEEKLKEANRFYYENVENVSLTRARRPLYEKILRKMEKSAPAKKGKILDVGCGNGEFLRLAADRGWEVYGVEHAKRLRDWARNQLSLHGVASDLSSFDKEKKNFDAVTFLDMLGQTSLPAKYLQKGIALLKPGGIAVVRARNGSFHIFLRRLSSRFAFLLKGVVKKEPFSLQPFNFTGKSLRLLLEKQGLRDVQVINSPVTGGDPYRVFRWGFLSSFLKGGILAWAKIVEWITFGRILLGPSLLALGRKP